MYLAHHEQERVFVIVIKYRESGVYLDTKV